MNDQTPWQETPYARAWKNFTESVEFRNLLDTSIKDGEDARYATNRLRCAFDMGYFEAIIARKKTFEIRVNDRDFQVGDMLVLQEYEPHTGYFSGREIKRQVTYIAQGVFGLPDDICVMALKAVEATHGTRQDADIQATHGLTPHVDA